MQQVLEWARWKRMAVHILNHFFQITALFLWSLKHYFWMLLKNDTLFTVSFVRDTLRYSASEMEEVFFCNEIVGSSWYVSQ